MHILVAAIWGFALNLVATFVGRILVALGVGFVTYTGLSVTLEWLKAQVVVQSLGLPADVLGMLSTLKVGSSISIIVSAILARLLINGMSGDTFKKWTLK